MKMSYSDYLVAMGLDDSRRSWIEWKIDIHGMSERDAVKMAYDAEFGYSKVN